MANDDTQRLYVNIEARLANYEKQLARANQVTRDSMRGVADTVDRRMREAERRAEQAGVRINNTLRQSFSGLKGSLLSGGSGAASLLGIGALTAGFGALGAEIVDTMGRAQNLNTRLTTLLGSEKEAAKVQEYLAGTAQKLSVDYFTLGDSYARLLPMVNSGIISTGDARKILEGFSNVAAATGATTTQLSQSLFGLAQGLTSGTLRAEELNQITEPLPGILQAMDRAFVKVTGSTDAVAGSFRRAVNDGEVTSNLLRTVLTTALGEYDGAAERMSGNVTASLTRLRNEWSLVVTEMSKSLADPFTDIISGASTLIGLLGQVAKNYNALPDAMKSGNMAFAAGVAAGEVTAGLPAGTTANEFRERARAEAQEIENTIKQRIARREELSRLPVAPDGQPVNDEAARELGAINDELTDLNKRLPEVKKKYEEFDAKQGSLADGVRELRREMQLQGAPFPPTIPDRPSTAAGLPPLPKKGSLEYESTFGDAGGVIEEKAKKPKAAKEPKDNKLAEHIRMLQVEADRLSLSGVALKENELLTEALAQAKEDYKNKLRTSAELTDAETASIKANAKVLAGVPDILALAKDNLPEFNAATEMKRLTELQGLLADPAVIAALEAQGLSAENAGKAIQAQILAVKDEAAGTTEAIQGIGEAFQSGIQGAQSFEDAVLKIGIALGQMLLQAAAFGGGKGGGPLGGLFDSLTGLVGGLAGLAGGGSGGAVGGAVNAANSAVALLPRAGGGPLNAGQAAIINELGQEAASRGGDLFIPGKATRIIPADATRKAAAAPANGSSQPILFNISMAGANGDTTIRAIAAQAVKQGLSQVPEINRQHRIRFSQ